MTKTSALLRCNDYEENRVYETIRKLMELVPPPDVTGKVLLLKPNILQPKSAEYAICTHPSVVKATARIFFERGAKRIIVGESPATAGSLAAAKASGIYDAVIAAGAEWVSFDKAVPVTCSETKLVNSFNFAEPYTQADMVVSLSKLKTHQLLAYTGAMKNLFGLMVGLQKAETHFRFPNPNDFASFLTDINVAVKPIYGIMDAVVAMEGHGPANGHPLHVGVLGASDNVLSLDWAFSSLIGYYPESIPNLKEALTRGIWGSNPEEFKTIGDDFNSLKPANFKIVRNPYGSAILKPNMPKFLHWIAKALFTKVPTFKKNVCIRCGRCEEICPAHTIKLDKTPDNPVPHIDKKKCIHCYCCHEICPVNAITLKHTI